MKLIDKSFQPKLRLEVNKHSLILNIQFQSLLVSETNFSLLIRYLQKETKLQLQQKIHCILEY